MEKRSESLVVEKLQKEEEMEEETDGDGGKRIRIHVGGLGGSVTEEDLHRMFGGGGSVEGVEIVRCKGRSFAYVDFLPSCDKSLSKLFTTYNGCAWKGGKLRLHKAKEHYLVRLKREWAEDDAQLAADVKPTKPLLPSQESQQTNTPKQLRIFFPALRTVKSLPFTGTGRHKYSFQRVQVPSLPINFCDCEEHSHPSHPRNQTQVCHGINDQELSIMNKVMDKLFQSEKVVSDTFQDRTELPKQQHHELHDGATAADEADEENLIINVVSSNLEEEKISEFQELKSSGTQASKDNVFKAPRNINGPPRKKRISHPDDYNNQNEFEAAIPSIKKNLPTHSKESGKFLGAHPDQPELDEQVSWSQKSSWKQLVGHSGSSTFSISHVLPDIASSTGQVEPTSGSSEVPHSDSKNQDLKSGGDLEGQLCEMELVDEGCLAPQPTNSIVGSNKSGRGPSWRQKSSWTQLVNDNSDTSFSIKQIVPSISFEQQFVPKLKGADAVSSTDGKFKEMAKYDDDEFTRGGSSSLGIGKERGVSEEVTVVDSDGACAPHAEKICNLTPKQASAGNVEIGETCSFMRSASSLKQWAKIKAALSGSLKRKNVES